MKHRSLRLWPAILAVTAVVAAGTATTGCIIHDDDDDDHGSSWQSNDPPQPPGIMLVSIDTDQTIEAEPGEGVGLFVEYETGGNWRFWTTCDTNYSNVACKFDAFASVDTSSEIIAIEGEDLEGFDGVEVLENGEAHFHAETASDVDIMAVRTTPGAVLRLELMIDGISDGRFIYWVGDGVLHEGAPSNPLDFEPTSP